MKVFISADIEGTTGIVDWDETGYGRNGYEFYRRQMTKEVAAAANGARKGGAEDIVIKDAHDSARNILPDELPEDVHLFRGWAKHPYCMMFGLDETFDGVILTGYHNAAGTPQNPLSHTMTTSCTKVVLNGELCPEAWINSLTASYIGVPVLMITGDQGVCEWMNRHCPSVKTVPVNSGTGAGTMSMHPATAAKVIEAAAQEAIEAAGNAQLFPMPEHFCFEVSYAKHPRAMSASFYPGAKLKDTNTVVYESDDWMDVLTFIHFAM